MGSRQQTQDPGAAQQIASEQDLLLQQIEDFRLQQLFLEEQRQQLIEQNRFDFEGLLSALQEQQTQQQANLDNQLQLSEQFLTGLGERNQQLQGVLDQQEQTRQRIGESNQRALEESGQFLTQVGQDVRGDVDPAVQRLTEFGQQTSAQAIQGDPTRQTRERQLASVAQGTQLDIDREQRRLLSQATEQEGQQRRRRQESLANLRGQTARTAPDRQPRTTQFRSITETAPRNFAERGLVGPVPERGFISGNNRPIQPNTPQEREEERNLRLRRLLAQGR